MKRADLEHVIRAAAAIVEDDIVVVGSQAILGQFPDAPDSLLFSQEADVYPRSNPERAIEIDGALGDGSQFHATNGYYAHGVGPATAKGPAGWEKRLVPVTVPARAAGEWAEVHLEVVGFQRLLHGGHARAPVVLQGFVHPTSIRQGSVLTAATVVDFGPKINTWTTRPGSRPLQFDASPPSGLVLLNVP